MGGQGVRSWRWHNREIEGRERGNKQLKAGQGWRAWLRGGGVTKRDERCRERERERERARERGVCVCEGCVWQRESRRRREQERENIRLKTDERQWVGVAVRRGETERERK